jgi:hypothetical protein
MKEQSTAACAGHDGRCECGAVVPCEEPDCNEPAGHSYVCPECLRAEKDVSHRSTRYADELPDPEVVYGEHPDI